MDSGDSGKSSAPSATAGATCSVSGRERDSWLRYSQPVNSDVVTELGEVLRSAGFDDESWAALVDEFGRVPPAAALGAVSRHREARFATLFELFIAGRAVERQFVREALSPLELKDLECAGVLERDGDAIRATLSLVPYAGLIIAGDRQGASRPVDVVQAVTEASQTLAGLTIREPVAAALDIGTGSGVQALLAARHAAAISGVDVNPRALSFARLGQRLNQSASIEWREGTWFDPVADERFDLIACNPPFVISPDRSYVYRDSEEGGEALCRRLVRESAHHLTEGGWASLLVSWTCASGDWSAPLRDWVSGLECDAVLFHYVSQDPLAYAVAWNEHLEASDSKAFDATVTRWVEHYLRAGVKLIGSGAIVLRRGYAGGTRWVRSFDLQRPPHADGGQQLRRIFVGGDFVARERLPDALLGGVWRLAARNRLEQTLFFEDESYAPRAASLSLDDGIGLSGQVDPRVLPVLFALDGQTPLGELVERAPVPDGLDATGFASLCTTTFTDLLERGFLLLQE